MQKRKVLALLACFMMIGLIASLTTGCGGGGGGGGGGGEETPQYGGQLVIWAAADPNYFDDAIGPHYSVTGPYQCLWAGDWTKGIAGGYGTKQCDWYVRGEINRMEFKTGKIAQSWEIGTNYIIFHLRDGVFWQNKGLPKGRAVTADDVVFSLERQKTLSTAYLKSSYPDLAAAMSISKVDETTVRIDCTSQQMPQLISMIEFMYIYPKDVIETFGDINAWDRAIGTGAFTFKQYVAGSYLYFERSDNYWETNPVGPGQGDQLPYLDSVKSLIVPDMSTADALFTTGQVDITTADFDRAEALKAACPDAKFVRFLDGTVKGVIYMRTDKADKPYGDVRVRQALQLAIDQKKIVDEYFGGEAEQLYWPVYPCKEYAGAYKELEDYPASVQELFGYNPTKAQQLLADAGYPDGFQAEVTYYNLYIYEDVITMVKDMWAEIGVDLTLKPVDYATITATQYYRNYNDMMYATFAGVGTYFKGINWSGTSMFNSSYVNDPVLNDYLDQMLAAYPNEAEDDSIHQEMLPYLLEQCYVLQTAAHYTYRFWWPWVKNYDGEGVIGYYGYGTWTQYVWIDEDLKAELGF